MLIGGVSTLFFNGNPLLRFDGYYVLADALGMPNLAQRANQYLAYLAKRYLLGAQNVRSPATAPGEEKWLAVYAIAAFLYRMLILTAICLFLIDTFFAVGVALAIWAIFNQLLVPLMKHTRFVFFDASLRRRRVRAVLGAGFGLGLAGLLLAGLPVSSLTRFEGVIWPPDDTQLVSETDGFVKEILEEPGSIVVAEQPILRLENLSHRGEMAVKKARMGELVARFRDARINDRVQSRIVQEQMSALEEEIDLLQSKLDGLILRSPGDGVFILPGADDLPDSYVRQGQTLGYVVNREMAVARVLVTQQDQDRITQNLQSIDLRVASALDVELPGKLLRAVPQARNRLPSKVLSVEGGGRFVTDPLGPSDLSTQERLFEYEIELPVTTDEALIGSRVHVRFNHGEETLWTQTTRRVRQLFLRRRRD